MFPTFEYYYSSFISDIKVLNEETQSKLIQILKQRFVNGKIPSKNYSGTNSYYKYEEGLSKDEIENISTFDKYFYPNHLVDEIYENEAEQIIKYIVDEFEQIKKIQTDGNKSNKKLVFKIKNIFDNSYIRSSNLIKSLVMSKRKIFDTLLIQYYNDLIKQEELNVLFLTEFNNQSDLTSLSSSYHQFISKRFIPQGYMLLNEIEKIKKSIETVGITISSDLLDKINELESRGSKYSNTQKSLDIIQWAVYAYEYKFVNDFMNKKNELTSEIEKYIENIINSNEESNLSSGSENTNESESLEALFEKIEEISNKIFEIIQIDIQSDIKKIPVGLPNNIKIKMINENMNKYLELYIYEYIHDVVTLDDENYQDIKQAVIDQIKLKFSFGGLINQLDNVVNVLENIIQDHV